MVKETKGRGKTIYVCEECEFTYMDREWAERCEAWDREHPGTCNVEVIQHGAPLYQDA
jgi:hypothetical protein